MTVRAAEASATRNARLLDGNVLVALSDSAHVHHDAAVRWFLTLESEFSTCPLTQGTLVRMLLHFRTVSDAAAAVVFMKALVSHPKHCFWPDDLAYTQVSMKGILGHRQLTDAYLAALARHHGGRLVTFDPGLAALHSDVCELLVP